MNLIKELAKYKYKEFCDRQEREYPTWEQIDKPRKIWIDDVKKNEIQIIEKWLDSVEPAERFQRYTPEEDQEYRVARNTWWLTLDDFRAALKASLSGEENDGKHTTTELNDDNLSELADNAARKAGHEKCLLFEGCNDGSMECGDCPYNFDGEY